MLMHKLKRFFIILFSIFCFIVAVISCFIYFFNINDYSKWFSEQLKQTTGYDIRFEMLENNWLKEDKLSVLGLSLYQQGQRIVYIDRLDVDIANLDLWSRQLAVKRLHLKGLELDFRLPLAEPDNNLENSQQVQREGTVSRDLPWQKLHISVFQITDMNVTIHHLGKQLLIKDAKVDLQDVLVIDDKKVVLLPEKIDVASHINELEFNHENLNVALQNINLSSKTSLLKRQAELDFSIANIHLGKEGYPPFLLNSLIIQSTFDNNRLTLKDLSFNTFSGSLSTQAEALLAINWLPKPHFKIADIQLNSLNAHDMHILIPNFINFDKQSNLDTEQYKMPIESFAIKQMNLENITLISEADVLPLALKSADVQINDLQVIKGGELLTASAERSPRADFSIEFSRLEWQESVIEEFSLSGNLETTELDLKKLLR